ncbi:uncharacterized protein LOC142571005 [Dermacentor variabilis]|uniref:uncharacterized protein LOC142571005 n=1 Tax=Dermacentor variabilis TaxID=34621 RepID=UPI003F5CB0E7
MQQTRMPHGSEDASHQVDQPDGKRRPSGAGLLANKRHWLECACSLLAAVVFVCELLSVVTILEDVCPPPDQLSEASRLKQDNNVGNLFQTEAWCPTSGPGLVLADLVRRIRNQAWWE